jgi:hypothetical protein
MSAVNVALDEAQRTQSRDSSALLTYFLSSDDTGVSTPDATASEGTEADQPGDATLGQTAQPLDTDSPPASALESADTLSSIPAGQIQSGVQIYTQAKKSAAYVQNDTACSVPVNRQEYVPRSESTLVTSRGPPPGYEEYVTDLHCSTYNGESQLRERTGENEGTNIGYTAPDLPGLELTDPDPANLAGQIIYLDFDGAHDVIYNGPITVGPFDVPAFQAPGGLAGQEQPIILRTLAGLEEIFAGSGVVFTTGRPSVNQPHSTIYIGGDGSAFSQYGLFLGLAEQVDVGSKDTWDNAFVFPNGRAKWPVDLDGYTAGLAQLIAHETAHLLGYAHESATSDTPGLPQLAAPQIAAISPSTDLWTPSQNVEFNVAIADASPTYAFIDWGHSLVGWWRGEGNTNDSSASGNNGTMIGGTYAAGKFGQCFSGAAVTIGDPDAVDFRSDADWSFACWVKKNDDTGLQSILSKGSFINLLYHSTDRWQLDIGNADSFVYPKYTRANSVGAWVHLAVTYDGDTGVVNLYVDGI